MCFVCVRSVTLQDCVCLPNKPQPTEDSRTVVSVSQPKKVLLSFADDE